MDRPWACSDIALPNCAGGFCGDDFLPNAIEINYYALKRYVDANLYDSEEESLEDSVSDYLRDNVEVLMNELRKLHTPEPSFGEFGAEITLFRIPHALDTARMLSNRGLLLEVLPILRLRLDMNGFGQI